MENKLTHHYAHVAHATENQRREHYHGCVSRQTLRAQLRREAIAGIRAQYPGESHHLVRVMAFDKARREYRNLVGLPEPR